MPLEAPTGATMLPLEMLGSAEPDEVLYEAEEPIVFTLRTAVHQRVLAYLADASSTARWLLMAPCSDELLSDLKAGRVPVREALVASWLWLGRLDDHDQWKAAWAVNADDLPPEHLPAPGVMLLPEHEPVLSTRAVGATIGRTSTPASVVAYVADATRKALKGLLELELNLLGQGRPSDDLRSLYDLPVQRMQYSSFEIAFSSPTPFLEDPSLAKCVQLLRRGLQWAASDDDTPLVASSDEEREAVLRAIRQLTPPTTGAIEGIDIGGQWMQHQPVALGRAARRRVQAELRRSNTERVARAEGRIRNFDKDDFTFVLRDTRDGVDVRGTFDESLYDDAIDFYTNDDRVLIAGVERGGRLYVAAVSTANAEDRDGGDGAKGG